MAADPISAADVRAAAQDVYDRLKHEMAEQARNTLLNDLAARLNSIEPDGDDLSEYAYGFEEACRAIRRWMNEQAPTEGGGA